MQLYTLRPKPQSARAVVMLRSFMKRIVADWNVVRGGAVAKQNPDGGRRSEEREGGEE